MEELRPETKVAIVFFLLSLQRAVVAAVAQTVRQVAREPVDRAAAALATTKPEERGRQIKVTTVETALRQEPTEVEAGEVAQAGQAAIAPIVGKRQEPAGLLFRHQLLDRQSVEQAGAARRH